MNKIMHVSEFLNFTMNLPETVFYRGESIDYGETACVATAIRDATNYDTYSSRIDFFDRKIRESALLDKPDLLIPFAQHSGLATKLLDVTSNPLVALYFACQQSNDTSDGHVYIFDDYADATDILEKYPNFDLEHELLKHIKMLDNQNLVSNREDNIHENGYKSVEHDELQVFGKCIEQYREKHLRGSSSKHSTGRGISKEDSLFIAKWKKLSSQLERIKSFIIDTCSNNEDMAAIFLPTEYTEDTSAIDFVHPLREKRYEYYNEQYRGFDIEVKEYLISLECLVAFLNDRSPISGLAIMFQMDNLTMDFLPNLLYQPVMTFKRGLSQQSSFFVQSLFDKHVVNISDGITGALEHHQPRQLLKSQANYSERIIIDGNSKETILAELDKIGVNKATMFGDADSIAEYTMSTVHKKSSY